eukprot:TRINITY_DN6386_c0_g3_i1.p1 TRINITY_DN6386_c0_g3~~TRINITY_DN6386_c0_g3_i1.p1  ORF type:complete len:118 (-),score=9.40 TRINITY_DN6386_c0_g3_i1:15-368(-)
MFALKYLLRKVESIAHTIKAEEWSLIRTSLGINGIIVHRRDLKSIVSFLKRYRDRKPSDELISYWACLPPNQRTSITESDTKLQLNETECVKEARIFTFRYNLFYHIGAPSLSLIHI